MDMFDSAHHLEGNEMIEEQQEPDGLTDKRTAYTSLKQAVNVLAAACDGALKRDKIGYNGADTKYGHLLAFLDLEDWPPEALHRAWEMLHKYHKQLAHAGINYFALPEPPRYDGQDRQITFHEATGDFVVVFAYDPLLVADFRQLPGADFQRKPVPHRLIHSVPGAGPTLLAFAEHHCFALGPGVQARLQQPTECLQVDHRYQALLEGGKVALYFPRQQHLNEEVKAIPGRFVSHKGGFHWVIPPLPASLEALQAFLEHHTQFVVAEEITRILREYTLQETPLPQLFR